jgi:hypothetical protein
VKARLVCPKCGKQLVAAVTRVRDGRGELKRRVHYHCVDKACDGEVENPTEYRTFVRPPTKLTPLGRWLALPCLSWAVPQEQPALGGGFARLSTRGDRAGDLWA